MCGITGYYLINSRHNSKKIVENMLNSINHRGPDDSGIELFDTDIKEVKEYKHNLALSNSRLSIIDLSKKGHQPMFNDDKSICLVYNGEIFNYVEIKRILEKKRA